MELTQALALCCRAPDNLPPDERARWQRALEIVWEALQRMASRLAGFSAELLEEAISDVIDALTRRIAPPEITDSAEGWLKACLRNRARTLAAGSRGVHLSLDASPADGEGAPLHERLRDLAAPTPEEALLRSQVRAALGPHASEIAEGELPDDPEQAALLGIGRALFSELLVPAVAASLRGDAAEGLLRSVGEMWDLHEGTRDMDALIGPQPDEAARRRESNAVHKNHQRARERLQLVGQALLAALQERAAPDPSAFGFRGAAVERERQRTAEVVAQLRGANPSLSPQAVAVALKLVDTALRQRRASAQAG